MTLQSYVNTTVSRDGQLCLQESLANANVSARQQCMYEGCYRRNLSSVENPTLEAHVIVSILYAAGFMLF